MLFSGRQELLRQSSSLKAQAIHYLRWELNNMRQSDLMKALVVLGTAALACGCSQESQEVNGLKHNVDQTKDEQKQLIEQRANELKSEADQNKKDIDAGVDSAKK